MLSCVCVYPLSPPVTLSPGVNSCRGGDLSNNMSLPDIVMDAGMMVKPAASIKLQQEFGPVKEKEEEAEAEEKEGEMMEVVCVGSSRGDGLSSDSGLMLSQGFERFATGGSTPSPVSEMHNPTNVFRAQDRLCFRVQDHKNVCMHKTKGVRSKPNKSFYLCVAAGVYFLDMLADICRLCNNYIQLCVWSECHSGCVRE